MPQGVTILRNNIGVQGGFGIDLGDFILGAGRDSNSTTLTNPNCNHGNGGSVTVPLRAQNFPIITGVDYVFNGASATTTVNATLTSAAGTAYNIDLFSNYPGALDTANRGIGATYITSKTTPPTDASGLVALSAAADAELGSFPIRLVANSKFKDQTITRAGEAEYNLQTVRQAPRTSEKEEYD